VQLSADALILAVDVGTSSVRAMLFDRRGNRQGEILEQIRYQPETTADGGVTIDVDALLAYVVECIDSVLRQAGPNRARIQMVAMDTLVGNLLGMDSSGNPTTPIYTWADTRGKTCVETLSNVLDPAEYTQRTGCRLHTSYWPVRLLWLQQEQPDSFRQTAYWLSFGDYMLYRLFGSRQISFSTASWSGLFNRHQLDWDAQTLAALPIRTDQLSTPSQEPLQGLSGEWADRWPALKNALWMPSIGDGVGSNIGAGCISSKTIALSVGTSGAMRIIVPGSPPTTPQGLFAYRVDAERTLIGGALSNAGNLYAWMQHTLGTSDKDDLRDAVASMEPDSHGLTILPFLAGERAPGWNDQAQAVFMGMTLNTAPEHLVRAGLEAISYRFYQIAQRLAPLADRDLIYVANGGAMTNSPTWMQITADVLNAPVYSTMQPEATILGTVLLAVNNEQAPDLSQAYLPDPARHEIYQVAIARQQALYERLFG
jgi:gluconokinase